MNTKLKDNNRLVPFQLVPKLFTWGRVERELAECSSSIQCSVNTVHSLGHLHTFKIEKSKTDAKYVGSYIAKNGVQ